MSIESKNVGRLFTGPDGRIYRLQSYCEHPTATMVEVGESGQKIGGAVASRNLADFTLLSDREQDLVIQALIQQKAKRE